MLSRAGNTTRRIALVRRRRSNIEGMKHKLHEYAEQSATKRRVADVRTFVELSYLTEALTELGKR